MVKKVLTRMTKQKEALQAIRRTKLQYLGHIMRGQRYHFLQLILERKKRCRKKKTPMAKNPKRLVQLPKQSII